VKETVSTPVTGGHKPVEPAETTDEIEKLADIADDDAELTSQGQRWKAMALKLYQQHAEVCLHWNGRWTWLLTGYWY
jgi:hypothetical protein